MAKTRKNKKKYYVNPKELHQELMNWKESDVASDELGSMFINLVEGLASKKNFSGYTWIDDMKGKAIEFLIKYARSYNPTKKNSNAFAYCTTIAKCAFLQFIEKENKQTRIRQTVYDNLVNDEEMLENVGVDVIKIIHRKNHGGIRLNDEAIYDLLEDYDSIIDDLKNSF